MTAVLPQRHFLIKCLRMHMGSRLRSSAGGRPHRKEKTEADSDKKALGKRIERIVIKEELGDACGDDSHVREVTGEYSVTEPEEFQNYWGDTINFGDASNLLHSSMREHLMILQRALGFQYVRFWSLFTKGFLLSLIRRNMISARSIPYWILFWNRE